MNKKGFVFMEIIVIAVILIVALLVLYSTFNKQLTTEKKRLYFDDVAYVYKGEIIRDIVLDAVNDNDFYENINENENGYVYLFGPQSKIYREKKKKYLDTLWNHYNIYTMGYISISNISNLKACLNNKITGFSTEAINDCEKTKNHLDSYSKGYLIDYFKTLDVDYNSESKMYVYNNAKHDGILIIMFSETKNGEKAENSLTYNKCIQDNAIDSKYGYCTGSSCCNSSSCPSNYKYNISNIDKQDAVKAYNADEKVSFNMLCETGFNIVWVYY